MTAKRFIKLIMSCGKQRNEARVIAERYKARGFSYKEAYADFRLKNGVEMAIKGLSSGITACGDNFRKAAAQVQKLAQAAKEHTGGAC